jgi:hypothetical protein
MAGVFEVYCIGTLLSNTSKHAYFVDTQKTTDEIFMLWDGYFSAANGER